MNHTASSSLLGTPSPLPPENLAESFFHKLSQPIGALYASLELGLMNDDPKQLKSAIEAGLTQLERLRWLFQVAREFFTIDYCAKAEEVSVRECVTPAVKDATPLAESKQVRVSIFVRQDAEVLVDPVHFRNAVENLLSHCIRRSAGGTNIKVEIRAEGNTARIEISDQSRFDSEFAQAAFEPFPPGVQIGPEQSGNLDLCLSQRIVRCFGGEIHLRATAERTNCFEVTLPRHHS